MFRVKIITGYLNVYLINLYSSLQFRLCCIALHALRYVEINQFEKREQYVHGRKAELSMSIGRSGWNLQRAPPRFPPELWNVHEATVNGAAWTNNQCEGWNNRFFHLIGYKHPSIWTLVEAIQMENRKVVTLITQDLIGQPPRKRICRAITMTASTDGIYCD